MNPLESGRKGAKPRSDGVGADDGGKALAVCVIIIASLSGGATATVALAGRASPTSANLRWILLLLGCSLLLMAWGALYPRFLHRRALIPWAKALVLAAWCHTPLLMGLWLLVALYTDDQLNHSYSASAYGQLAYRPLTCLALIVIPLSMQVMVLATIWRKRVAGWLPALAPLCVALVLRFWSIDWQLPYLFHDDERGYLTTAMISWAHGDPNPHRFVNPSVMFYLDTALFNLLGGAQSERFRVFAEALGYQLWDPRGTYLVALAARSVVALLGSATVALVYLATKLLFDRRSAIFAAWLLAVSFLHVRNSHYGTNDVVATCLATASFLFAVKLYRSGSVSNYICAGILGGLATSTKYNVGLFIAPLLVAHLARYWSAGIKEALLTPRVTPLLIGYGVSGLAFLAGTPYAILDWGAFTSDFLGQYHYGERPWFAQDALPTWWMQLTTLVQGFGALAALSAALGSLAMLRGSPLRFALVAAFPLIYYLFMSRQQLFFARFTIPMLPFLAILGGYGIALVAARLRNHPHSGLMVFGFLALILAQPAIYSIQSDLIIGRTDTRVAADRWISASLPENSLLLVEEYAGMKYSQGWPIARVQVEPYDPIENPRPWQNEQRRPLFVAISSFGYDSIRRYLQDSSKGLLPAPYKPVEELGPPVAVFNEGRTQDPVPYSLDDTYTPFWSVMDRERGGPAVRIYRLDARE